jgi:CAAX protease family protein
MLEQVSSTNVCRECGASLDQSQAPADSLCDKCRAQQPALWQPESALPIPPQVPYAAYEQAQAESPLDPDRPRWGIPTGLGVWIFSIAAIVVTQLVTVFLWYFLDKSRGIPVPTMADRQELMDWLLSPRMMFVQIFYSTVAAHLITLAFCWAVVTRFRAQPFLKSLGWNWAGKSAGYWLAVSIGIFLVIFASDFVFVKVLPQRETDFDKMLKISQQIRIGVALMATFSAPFVEEVIYRGVLYGGLRKRFGEIATVITVTLLFSGVHVLQYWGAWASIAGLTLLSLILTVVRARTHSILPSVLIHFINNAIVSALIVAGQQST